MVDSRIHAELLSHLGELPVSLQRRVLDFAKGLTTSRSASSGAALAALSGTLPAADADEIAAAIEEECERVDRRDW